MSLQRIAPRLILSCCKLNVNKCNQTRIPTSSVVRRGFSTSTTKKDATKLTAEEVEAALEKANESMKAYYSYPPEKVIAAKKARFDRRHRDKQFYLQLGIGEYTSTSVHVMLYERYVLTIFCVYTQLHHLYVVF